MRRCVLDTNVVVSALLWGGQPELLLRAAAEGELELCTSPALLAELSDVLARPHLAVPLSRHHASLAQALAAYAQLTLRVSPLHTPRVLPDDADDDHVIAATLAAQADAVVSGDRHLLKLSSHQGVSILTVAQALARLEMP
jgi:uncharacterized protein